MKRILTVDDSRAIRSIVAKQLGELGFELDEAEDGEQGLAHLAECTYDLVLLDVTMPVLDGPGMLAAMRARGDQTPVLMLTSESKRSIVAQVMKLGIKDYILKPFTPVELCNKVRKALGIGAAGAADAAEMSTASESSSSSSGGGGARQFVDILVVDDMDNVHKKLRGMIPPHVTMNSSVSARAALTLCQERVYRVVLIDVDIPDVVSSVLTGQLRALQAHAAFLALCLRTTHDIDAEMRGQGFDGTVFKPFSAPEVDDFLQQYFETQDLVAGEENVVCISGFSGREDRLDRYFKRLNDLMDGVLEKIAAACYDEAILDLSALPPKPDRAPRLIAAVEQKSRKMGLSLRLVGTGETRKLLSTFSDTSGLPFFDSVPAARAG